MRSPLADVATVELDASRVRSVLAEDAVEQRRLAAPVRSDDAENLALVEVEGHVVDRPDPPEGLGDVANRDDDIVIAVPAGTVHSVDRGHDFSCATASGAASATAHGIG